MANNNTPLDQLKGFLNQLFQFDSQDLDFGVYKILHYKRKEIANFIDQLLVDKVKEQLQTLSADESKQIKEQIADLEKDDIIKGWLEAEADEKKTLEKFGKDKIKQYKELKAKATEATVSVETENQIYNHLTLFFSRYYDKGDFISKRRFGKNEKYMVPYNGEETHFHWANHDQYYIKSSETFNHYAFKVQTTDGNLVVNFKLHNAQLEQGNVKADEPNFFLLADKAPEIKEKDDSELNFVLANKQPDVSEEEITIYFEYRPLADDEKKKVKGNSKQDNLDEIAFEYLKKEFSTNPLFANLWKLVPNKTSGEQEGKPLLLKKLQHYTRKNKHDFFIHKNLKSFLERELDYYIKSELIHVDDLYVTDSDTHFDRLKHNLKTIKVFKTIADTIIVFVSQIEDFQKKLWEKKKFVLNTEWVITIDRLVEYIGEEAAKPILEVVIKSEKQVNEWEDLFGIENLPKQLSLETFKTDFYNWKKLPIDTINFKPDFKQNLLNALSQKINLDGKSDGLVINSDNFHGLVILRDLFANQISFVHIDPPYNTSSSGFLYKNTFQHSSWLSMMYDRVKISFDLISESGAFVSHIDENEYERYSMLLNLIGNQNLGTMIWDKGAPVTGAIGIATQHEYLLWRSKSSLKLRAVKENISEMNSFVLALVEKYGSATKNAISEYRAWLKSNKKLSKAEKIYDLFDDGGRIYSSGNMAATDKRKDKKFHIPIVHPKTNKECPVPTNGWRYTPDTINTLIKKDLILFGDDESNTPRRKTLIEDNESSQLPSITRSGHRGKYELDSLGFEFPFAHSTDFYTTLTSSVISKNNSYVLDFFGGSGTSFHATQKFNNDTGLSAKCILIEQGPYLNSLIVPRIKKIGYTFDWKDGNPKDDSMNGLGVFFKYQRLEQYEEALENIAFKASEDTLQKALEFDQYIPKYFLEFETKGSKSLVNTAAMQDPWDYKLKVWDGFTYDTEQAVDLVETFNYLIGLHMQKCITKEINGKKYQFIYGHNNANKNILVVWRSVKDWSLQDYKVDAAALKEEFKAFTYDLLYINDQAHIEGYQPTEEVFRNKMLS